MTEKYNSGVNETEDSFLNHSFETQKIIMAKEVIFIRFFNVNFIQFAYKENEWLK